MSRASGEWMNRSCESWSATIRLISSGIVRSNERSPASTCPTGMLQLGGRQRRSQRRVHVAGDEHDVRLGLEQHRLEPLHHAAPSAARANRSRLRARSPARRRRAPRGRSRTARGRSAGPCGRARARTRRRAARARPRSARSSSCSAASRPPTGLCAARPFAPSTRRGRRAPRESSSAGSRRRARSTSARGSRSRAGRGRRSRGLERPATCHRPVIPGSTR